MAGSLTWRRMADFHLIATSYVEWDPNPESKEEMRSLLNDKIALGSILDKRLAFGTAGLRGPMGIGYCRMNELVILQTTQGLLRHLQSVFGNAEVAKRGVVIGYDHRKYNSHSSRNFAYMCASVLKSEGVKVYMLERFVATPFVAFGVTHLNCVAGVMVTASHNPKRDNGFKVYWSNGSQIISPHDAGIASAIEQNLKPWRTYSYNAADVYSDTTMVSDVTDTIVQAYYEKLSQFVGSPDLPKPDSIRIAYTAMHGVGHQWTKRSFELFGHPAFHTVLSQAEPDPEFRTVSFPNPEEKGALNEAMIFANRNNCTIIIANDPDADRLGAAERFRDPISDDDFTCWRIFTGNEIGTMLGHRAISQWKSRSDLQKRNGLPVKQGAVLASVVSSRMLKAIAVVEGAQYFDTLTGFKWLGNKAIELQEKRGYEVLFLYEEALGFCVVNGLVDKDGVSAAGVFAEMIYEINARRKFPNCVNGLIAGHLQDLYDNYGEFVSYNSYVISHNPDVTNKIFERLRSTKGSAFPNYWSEVAGIKIKAIKDITMGYDSAAGSNAGDADSQMDLLPCTPESHMIMFTFENGCSVTLRTSGTEPKIKFYTEIAGSKGESRNDVFNKLKNFVNALVDEMLQPELNGLGRV